MSALRLEVGSVENLYRLAGFGLLKKDHFTYCCLKMGCVERKWASCD